MTDIGNCRPPPTGVVPAVAPISGTGSTSVLMSTSTNNGVGGQSGSASYIHPTVNGVSPTYANIGSTVSTAGVVASSSSAGPVNNANGDQQRKQQTAFIVLPISFRVAAGGNSGAGQSQLQQNVSSSNSPANVGPIHAAPSPGTPSAMKGIHQQPFSQPGSTDSFIQKQPISSDQAVKTAVNWIVQDAKQRQQQQQQHQESIPHQQIYHRNNGKVLGPPMPSPAAVAMKRANEVNSRKFSTSSSMQNEVS